MRWGWYLVAAGPAAFLVVFFAWPVARILVEGLAPRGQVDLGPLLDVLGDAGLRGVAWFTLWQALASTALTLLVALPGAYVVARYDFPGRRLVRAVATVSFVLPTVVVGVAFLALLRPVDLQHTVWAVLAAHVFFNYAVVLRVVGGLWSHLDPRMEEAARVLGAGRWQVLRHVTAPLLWPAVAAAAAIVLLFTFTSFGVVLILGGPRLATLEVEIYRQTAQLLDLPVAASLALLQLVAVGTGLALYAWAGERRSTAQRLRPAREVARRPVGWRQRTFVAANLVVMAAVLGTPLAVLVGRSLDTGSGWGFDAYRALSRLGRGSTAFVAPLDAVRNSLVFAATATVLALAVGTAAAVALAWRGRPRWAGRGLDTLLMLPLGTSAVTVGFGFLLALDRPPLDLRTSTLLVPIAHALVAVPFVVRTVVPVLRSIDPRLRDAAAVLGASPIRVWREVDLRLAARAAMVGAGFAFAVSLGEFGATVFIARPDTATVPVAIFRFLSRPGALGFGAALAMSTVLMLLTAAAVAAIERVRVGEAGEL